jgi:putative transposase
VTLVCNKLNVSERRACKVLTQPRSTQRRKPKPLEDESRLTREILDLACRFGRYGYRRVTAILRREGWRVNHKRVERIWKREGLKVPKKQPKRGRLWLTDGSCLRMRPEYRNHVWTYDFVADRTKDGRALKMLTLVDEFSRECLTIEVSRRLRSMNVLEILSEQFLIHGAPEYIRSDNGSEFTAELIREWLARLEVQTLYIEPGSPWENGYIESWRQEYNEYRPPAPQTTIPVLPVLAPLLPAEQLMGLT